MKDVRAERQSESQPESGHRPAHGRGSESADHTHSAGRPGVVYRLEPSDLENCDLEELFDAVAAWQEGVHWQSPGNEPSLNAGATNGASADLHARAAHGADFSELSTPSASQSRETPPTSPLHSQPARLPSVSPPSASQSPAAQPPASSPQQWAADVFAGPKSQELERIRQQLRAMTDDFERYRKRTEQRQREEAHKARQTVVQALLPVLDDLRRADALRETSDTTALREGVRLVAQRLEQTLGGFGLEPFDSAGRPFDPAIHEALRLEPSTAVPANYVVTEISKGYRFGGVLLRPARVSVAAPAVASPPPQVADPD